MAAFTFDTQANILGMEIRDEWREQVRTLHHENKDALRKQFLLQYGQHMGDEKIKNMIDIKPIPFPCYIGTYFNPFLFQIRDAFIMAAYFSA